MSQKYVLFITIVRDSCMDCMYEYGIGVSNQSS
jgi:hypothetical protein